MFKYLFQPEGHQHPGWIAGQSKKMELGVKRLFTLGINSSQDKLSYEAICVANVLWYLNRRYKDWKWWRWSLEGVSNHLGNRA